MIEELYAEFDKVPQTLNVGQGETNIVCIGDSITNGTGASVVATNSYPALLQEEVPASFKVKNYGLGGRGIMRTISLPYWNEPEY
jgi:lysophospholipase L1-like esterase